MSRSHNTFHSSDIILRSNGLVQKAELIKNIYLYFPVPCEKFDCVWRMTVVPLQSVSEIELLF